MNLVRVLILKSFAMCLMVLIFVSCQTAPEEPNQEEELQAQQQMEELRESILSDVTYTIRNEILPELREIQLGNKRSFVVQQRKILKNVSDKILIGRVEWIKLLSPDIAIRARVDTGAQTCSLHAEDIVEKEIDGVRYVEFTTLDEKAKPYRMVKKIIEETKVKSTSGKSEKRFVVEMSLLFGKRNLVIAVNLNDRRSLKHRFLVGRNLLLGNYIVDVSQSRVLGKKP